MTVRNTITFTVSDAYVQVSFRLLLLLHNLLMVGLYEPSPSKAPDVTKPNDEWWKGKVENPIQIKRPAQGMHIHYLSIPFSE